MYVRAFGLAVVAAGTGSNKAAAACGIIPRRDWDECTGIQSFYHLYCLESSFQCSLILADVAVAHTLINSDLMLKILLVFVILEWSYVGLYVRMN